MRGYPKPHIDVLREELQAAQRKWESSDWPVGSWIRLQKARKAYASALKHAAVLILAACLSGCSMQSVRRDFSDIRVSANVSDGKATAGAGVDFVLRPPDGFAK